MNDLHIVNIGTKTALMDLLNTTILLMSVLSLGKIYC